MMTPVNETNQTRLFWVSLSHPVDAFLHCVRG